MKLYQIVMKDIWSRKRRVLYATLGVVIGTMTVIGTLTIAVAGKAKIYNQLEKYGPNLTVVPAISNLDMKLGDLSMGTLSVGENYIPQEKLPEIRRITDSQIREALDIDDEGNIATLAPKLYINTKVRETSVMLIGIDPKEELNVRTWWEFKQGEYISQPDQALVGALAAQLLEFNIGDKIDLNGREVTVTSILGETGASDDYQIFVPLATVQQAFNKEGLLSSIDIRALCNACPVEMISTEINKQIPGVQALAVKQIAASEMGLVEKMNMLMLALAGITLAVGLFGVVNTMITAVHERIKDIGIMRAVGASQGQIIRVFIYEAIVVGILGGILGYIVGTLLAFAIGPVIFEGATITFVPQYLPLSLALATFIAILATVYPAFRATKIRVADSFRSL